MKTRITELLGTRYPILQETRTAERAAAVSNAGGLGLLTALAQPNPEALAREIARCRGMTDRPFGVHLSILSAAGAPPYAEYLQAAIDSGVRVLETLGNSPAACVENARRRGVRIVHRCASLRHALSAERRGVDAMRIDSPALIPLAARTLRIPVIAAWGHAHGRALASALAMGAEGVHLGAEAQCGEELMVRMAREFCVEA